MIRFSLELSENQKYVTFPFYRDNVPLKGADGAPVSAHVPPNGDNMPPTGAPLCGMTVRAADTMRFRWNEENPQRAQCLSQIAGQVAGGQGQLTTTQGHLNPVPLELIHSKTVYDLRDGNETYGLQGDGMITRNSALMPVVTVADCMPLYLYDSVTGVFGVVHSGWKGTGIVGQALELAKSSYGARAEDFSIVIGPHIRNCCYIVDEERVKYFTDNFGSDCVSPLEEGGKCYAGGRGLPVTWNNGSGKLYRLSLEKANLNVLARAGVREENIAVCNDCTCCNELLGSNRRETADFLLKNPNATKDELGKCFTVQGAFIGWI